MRVSGPSLEQLDRRGDTFAALIRREIKATLGEVAPHVSDVDDLNVIRTKWAVRIDQRLADHVMNVWWESADDTHAQLVRASGRVERARPQELIATLRQVDPTHPLALVAAVTIPHVLKMIADFFRVGVKNRLRDIGDIIWNTTREQIIEGNLAGESIEQIRDRIIATTDIVAPRAEVIARTEVIAASEAGSYEQMKATGFDATKEWLATNDGHTRPAHAEVNGEIIDMNAKFTVGGWPMDRPHDPTAPIELTINCRCTLLWDIPNEEFFDDVAASAFHLLGKHDQSSHGRSGNGGGKSGELQAGKPLKITHALVHKKHEPDTTIAITKDDNKKAIWGGEQYDLQSKQSDGQWKTDKTVIKSKAYVAINEYASDWHEPVGEDKGLTPPSADEPSSIAQPLIAAPKLMSGYKKIGAQQGSQLGGLFTDDNDKKQYVKASKSANHAKNEVLASELYKLAGVQTPKVEQVIIDGKFFPSKDQEIGTQSSFIENHGHLTTSMKDSKFKTKLYEGFAVDAWLANWDVIGLSNDNIIIDKDGNPARIDSGGALLYRAQGSPKGSAFGNEVTEVDTLRNPFINPSAGKVYKDITDEDIRKGVKKIEAITPEQIDELVDAAGLSGVHGNKLKKTLKARRQNLIDRYGDDTPTKPLTPAPTIIPGPIPAPEPSPKPPKVKSEPAPAPTPSQPNSTPIPSTPPAVDQPKTYTSLQKVKVQTIFQKNGVKWHNDSKNMYTAALEVSTTHPDLTMSDALDIMDQSLLKKTGNPFRTKIDKFLKTKAGKQFALEQGGSAPANATQQTTPAVPVLNVPISGSPQQPRKITRQEAHALQKNMNQTNPPPWNGAQQAALKYYTSSAYVQINKCLRNVAPAECTPAITRRIKAIKAAMKPSTDDIILYRRTNANNFGLSSPGQIYDLVGKIIKDKGVVSTSITDGVWHGEFRLEITAPRGSRMSWVQPISHHYSEDEMILASGTDFEITSVEVDPTGQAQQLVKLRIVPGSGAL